MDRRNFFKSFLAAPFLTPFLFSSQRNQGENQLYVISEHPHQTSSFLLKELQKRGLMQRPRFQFLNFHPHEDNLRRELQRLGWTFSQNSPVSVVISHHLLEQKTTPSFTFIKGGHIQDIRNHALFSLWKDMSNQAPSSSLTVFTFKKRNSLKTPGETALVYREGSLIDDFSLSRNETRAYPALKGKMALTIKNRQVRILKASCAQKICLHSHPISLAGERIVCAPNHFLIEIRGNPSVDTSIG